MAVREFDGVDDYLTFDPGGIANVDGGPLTIAFIWKPLSSAVYGGLPIARSAGGYTFTLNNFTDGWLWLEGQVGTGQQVLTYAVADGWQLSRVSKVDGNAQTRGSKYVYSSNTWTHSNSVNNMPDSSGNTPATSIELGKINSNYVNARIAVMGLWDSVLADADVETLENSLSNWAALNPKILWAFNQADVTTPVPNIMGNGGGEMTRTGTTVVNGDDPPGFDFTVASESVGNDLLIGGGRVFLLA